MTGRATATACQVAAEFVMKRVKGVTVTPHYCPIQDKDAAWYKQFQVIVMGLDSIEALRWLNGIACGLVEYETLESGERKPDLTCALRARPRPRAPAQPPPLSQPRPRNGCGVPGAQHGHPAGGRRHRGLLGPRARPRPGRRRRPGACLSPPPHALRWPLADPAGPGSPRAGPLRACACLPCRSSTRA